MCSYEQETHPKSKHYFHVSVLLFLARLWVAGDVDTLLLSCSRLFHNLNHQHLTNKCPPRPRWLVYTT